MYPMRNEVRERTGGFDPIRPVILEPEDIVVRLVDDRFSAGQRVRAFRLDLIVDDPVESLPTGLLRG